MNKHPLPALAGALALALGLGSCIITIDDTGTSWHSLGSLDGGSGPTHKGSGVRAEDPRVLPAFDRIDLEGSLDMQVTIDPAADQAVVIAGDDNLLEFVRTEVRDGTLTVGLESGSYNMRQDLRVQVTLPSLRAADLLGSGDLSLRGLQGGKLSLALMGSGDILADGRVEALAVELLGSGSMDLAGLAADEARVELRGSGDVRVFAREALIIDLLGSGEVGYRGDPKLKLQVTGSGDVYSFD